MSSSKARSCCSCGKVMPVGKPTTFTDQLVPMVGPDRVCTCGGCAQPASNKVASSNANRARRPWCGSAMKRSATEVVQHDVVTLDAKILKHLDHRSVHHRRPAHVELTVFRRRMILEVLLVQHVMDKAGQASPVVFRLWIGQCQVPVEVVVFLGQLVVLVDVEGLAQRACAVPEADLALGAKTLELVKDVRTHR